MNRINLFLCFFFVLTISLTGQDMHFSNYHFTPLTVNPAFTGAFRGTFRVGGIYKDNYTVSQSANGFHTINVFGDSPIMKGFRSSDWIGIGLETNQFSYSGAANDASGTSAGHSLNWTNFKISGSYHFSLDKKQNKVLTLGVQLNTSSLNFNQELFQSGLNTRFQYAFGGMDPDMTTYLQSITTTNQRGNQARASFRDFIGGLLYVSKTKNAILRAGFAMEGISRPRYGSRNGGTYNKPIGLHFHAEYDLRINKNTRIIPAAYYYSIGAANALNVNGRIKYLVNEEKDFTLVGGLGMRNFRQALLLVGAEFGKYQVGGSFDFDLAESAIASQGFHGFELSLIYTGVIYKKPKAVPVILCPRI